MRKVDPSIVLIASGEMLEDGQVPGDLRSKYVGNLAGALWQRLRLDRRLFEGLLGQLRRHGASTGMRSRAAATTWRRQRPPPDKPNDDAYDKIDQTTLEYARYPANIVRSKAEEWEGYQQRFPAMLPEEDLSLHRRVRLLRRQLRPCRQSEAGAGLRHALQRDAPPHRLPDHGGAHHGHLDHRLQPDQLPR